jgi:acetyltransferase-like isoleucine patch superfamily enzyme
MNYRGLKQRYRHWSLRRKGALIARSTKIGPLVSLGPDHLSKVIGSLVIGETCDLCQGVELNPFGGSITILDNVWIGPYVVIYGHGGVVIGNNTLISMHTTILSSNHTIPPLGINIRDCPDQFQPTFIGADVWIGANSVILGGISIGSSAIVAAGSVVTKDVSEGSIVAGVPAKEIKRRVSLTLYQ